MQRTARTAIRRVLFTLAGVLFGCPASDAHPAPFSYLDLRPGLDRIDAVLIVHAYDAAHDLAVERAETLLDPSTAGVRRAALAALLERRFDVRIDGHPARPQWDGVDILPERASLRLRFHYPLTRAPGALHVHASLFPYDRQHQTFVNIFAGGTVAHQAILDASRPDTEYFPDTPQGTRGVIRRFVPAGVHHILIGPDHILFLIGLLLLRGSLRRLLLIVSAFTLAHSVTLSLAALGVVAPPAGIVEPAIALSIVYVGADNLLARGGRDLRAWIAFGFGLVHGFGFASVLAEIGLPPRALAWSLVSFNVGVEIGQVLIVGAAAVLLLGLQKWSEPTARLVATAGSVVVMCAGAFWFVERVFFPGGLS